MGNSESKPDAVIAIEIGHVNSGFAYSLERNKNHIYTARFGCVLPMDRVPTILLLNKDEELDSFGIAARDKYISLSLQEEHTNYRYFNNFTVCPGEQPNDYIVKDSRGNSANAEEIYAFAIGYFYKLGTANIQNISKKAKITMVVLTIPGGTDYYMWDIIHAAARRVGIKEEHICILFNWDATALYCSKQDLFLNENLATSKIKTKYIMMNMGGRRTSILTEQVGRNTSEEYGGEYVTDSFLKDLGSMKDKTKWNDFQSRCIYDFECIKLNFEKLKHKFNGTDTSILELPVSFCKLPENKDGGQLSSVLKDLINDADNKLEITKEAMQKFFNEREKTIVEALQRVKKTIGQEEEEVKILLAGGFSESPYVRQFISREMSPRKVLLVPNPSLDVLKGAVMTGYTKFRRAKYSYWLQNPDGSDECKFENIIEKREMLENEREYKKLLNIEHTNNKTPIAVHLVKFNKTAAERDDLDLKEYDDSGTVEITPPDSGWQRTDFKCELVITVKEKGLHLVLVLTETEEKLKGSIVVPY